MSQTEARIYSMEEARIRLRGAERRRKKGAQILYLNDASFGDLEETSQAALSSPDQLDRARRYAMLALRVGVALEFFGHGLLALSRHEPWVMFFAPFGIDSATALTIMPLVGALDVFLAGLVLIRPVPAAVLWMALWGFWTACLRPIAGMSVIEFVERGANWGAPLALLLLMGLPRTARDWFR